MGFSLHSMPGQLLLLLGTARTTSAGPMAAWWTTIGPQILMQNTTTGGLQYSMCNSNSTPIFPNDPPLLLSLSKKPRNGTAIAGTGWWDNTEMIASVFYQDTEGDLYNAYLKCNANTGRFSTTGTYLISGTVPSFNNEKNINANTGLASILLGDTAGYRVYYHDLEMGVRQIGYTQDSGWMYEGVVSQDPATGTGLGTQFSGSNNISVVAVRDAANIEVSRYYSDELWHISSLPEPLSSTSVTNATNTTDVTLSSDASKFTLSGWDGNATSLGISISSSYIRSIFYIGTDKALHQVANVNSVWQLKGNQTTTTWPLADKANADFAIASDLTNSVVRIYYFVNETLTEISNGDNETWIDAVAVATYSASTPVSSPEPGSSTGSSTTGASSNSKLSTGAKVGIGVGSAAAAIALISIAGMTFVIMRRRKASNAASKAEQRNTRVPLSAYANSYSYGGSPRQLPASPYTDSTAGSVMKWPQEVAADTKPIEVANTQRPLELDGPRGINELEEQNYSHELMGEGHWRELPANEVRR